MNARRRLASVALVLAVPVLSSCTVNFDEQTDKVYNPSVGVDDRSGKVDVLNALVVSAAAGSGTVVTTLVNGNQTRDDALKGIAGAGSSTSLTVTPGGPTTIGAGGLLNLADGGENYVSGEAVQAGEYVTLTFTFEHAEAITLQVPVVADGDIYDGVSLPPVPSSSATPSGTASPSEDASEGASGDASATPSAEGSASPSAGESETP